MWTSSLNGQIGTGSTLSTTALSPGTHVITLMVRDAQNLPGVATRTVVIIRPPTAAITSPMTAGLAVFKQGTSVTFAGQGIDPEDGALTGASLVWTSSRDGQIGTGGSFSRSNLTAGSHTITLTAKDWNNTIGTASRTITIVP